MTDTITEADVKRVCEENFETGKVFYLPLRLNDLSITVRISYCVERGHFVAETGTGLGEYWTPIVIRTSDHFVEQFSAYMEETYGVTESRGLALAMIPGSQHPDATNHPKH